MKNKMMIKHKENATEEQMNLMFRTNLQSGSGVWDHQFEYVFTDET